MFGRSTLFGSSALFLGLCSVSIACSRPATLARSASTQLEPFDLYPLTPGNVWSYDVNTGEAITTLAVTRVDSFDGRDAEVRTGEAVIRYRILPEGIFIPEDRAWLIKGPIEKGTAWRSRGGRTAHIASIDRSAKTPAGEFKACVEVVETGGELGLQVRTTYCPGVGPVTVISSMQSQTSDRILSVEAKLRGYSTRP